PSCSTSAVRPSHEITFAVVVIGPAEAGGWSPARYHTAWISGSKLTPESKARSWVATRKRIAARAGGNGSGYRTSLHRARAGAPGGLSTNRSRTGSSHSSSVVAFA